MHLLAAQAGALQQDGEAIDLGQSPAPIIFASSADSELALIAGAVDRAGTSEVRLANLLRLSHNLSVDLWLDKTVQHAELVVVRLLGGAAYWRYGVEQLSALAEAGRFRLALLPGDATADVVLQQRSTVSMDEWLMLHQLFVAGGPENADAILQMFANLATPSPTFPALAVGVRQSATPVGRVEVRENGEVVPYASSPLAETNGRGVARPFPRFGHWTPIRGLVDAVTPDARPSVPLLFYRAALEGAGTAVLEAICAALEREGVAPLPLMISSLKEAECVAFVRSAFAVHKPDVILNLTGFALGLDGLEEAQNPFAGSDAPVIQLVQSGRSELQWAADSQGLSAKDLAMQLVLPELDGRIGGIIAGHKAAALWHAATQSPLTAYAPDADGIARAVELAANWVRLRQTARAERRVGIVLANYPIRDGRLANGVGYDAPESTTRILRLLNEAGYDTASLLSLPLPENGNVLIEALQAGPTNAHPGREGGIAFEVARYRELLAALPAKMRQEVTARWGAPEADPFVRGGAFHLPAIRFGNVVVMLQPARGYDRDAEAAYHDPDLVPPHAYLATYLWLKHQFGAHALIHNGKHGSLEWLPGKAVALDGASYPAALWGGLPHLYPFIVNDPGEGTQAKRRTGAVIIDHLVPPLTRAEIYGPLKELEALLDEYAAASGMDRRRVAILRTRILHFAHDARLDADIRLPTDEAEAIKTLDGFLCELKEAQIRDGLHVFGQSPAGRLERDLLAALARVPRGERPEDGSIVRALADDLGLGFDPLTAESGETWSGPTPASLLTPTPDPSPLRGGNEGGGGTPRTLGHIVELLEEMAAALIDGAEPPGPRSAAVMREVEATMRPKLRASGPGELKALLDGLDGKFVPPGPSGAPSRGRLDVLPTGRNFYSIDTRAVPTQTAWELGQRSAEAMLTRHFQDHGTHLRSLALSVWGTSCMRTGGDDIAQALAFVGARPTWDPGSLRVAGYEVIPLAKLGRPRVDVTLRISGLFRDAFPQQVVLFDKAVRAIGALDEPMDQNPIAVRMRADAIDLMKAGATEAEAALSAGHRVFGSKPGAYGAGLQALMDGGKWASNVDLGKAFLNWGQYAYGAHAAGTPERERFAAQLGDIEAVVQNQDNREHDLLDSDDYYQFEGGLVATAESLTGRRPVAYHNDHSRPERPMARTLEEEIARVMRSRVVNPKWIMGVMRHGYKGAFEIIATVDYMFAFAATTGAVKTHQFDLAFAAFVEDEAVREFIRENNPWGYDELIQKFNEARERGFWTPRSNGAFELLAAPHPAASRPLSPQRGEGTRLKG